jgi:hypothetical protein
MQGLSTVPNAANLLAEAKTFIFFAVVTRVTRFVTSLICRGREQLAAIDAQTIKRQQRMNESLTPPHSVGFRLSPRTANYGLWTGSVKPSQTQSNPVKPESRVRRRSGYLKSAKFSPILSISHLLTPIFNKGPTYRLLITTY